MNETTLLIVVLSVLFLGGATIFGVQAYKAHNSGSTTFDDYGLHESPKKVPYTQIGQFWFAVGLVAVWVASMLAIYADR